MLPGFAFFVDCVELPPALEPGEIENFAELSLESLSPFPVEQLCWGFLKNQESGSILLYATHRERLKQLGYESLEDYLWVLPDFAPFAAAHFPAAVAVCLESESALTRFDLPVAGSLPENIVSRPGGEQLPEAGKNVHSFRWLSPKISEKGLPTFHLEPIGEESPAGHWDRLKLDENSLWRADVRPLEFKRNERNRRRMASLVTRLTGYAAYAALFLILLELLLLIGNTWIGTREATIAGQLPEVRRVEDKQSLMNKLDQVAQSELRPIAMLEALNESRPPGIYFTSTVTEGRNRITIDGIANTINELNAYTESLRRSGRFEMIGNPKQITRSGKTTFTVTLDYTHREATPAEQATLTSGKEAGE